MLSADTPRDDFLVSVYLGKEVGFYNDDFRADQEELGELRVTKKRMRMKTRTLTRKMKRTRRSRSSSVTTSILEQTSSHRVSHQLGPAMQV